jgi:hypothetical protein
MRVHGLWRSAHAGFSSRGEVRRESAVSETPGGAAARGRTVSSLASLAGGGVVGAVRAQWRRGRRRALADEWLRWGAAPREESRLLGPRAEELTSAKSRRALAKVCRRYVAEIRDPPCRAYAVNRVALREHVGSLARLGARLSDLSRPASPHSILFAREVVDGSGPLFNRARADELGPAITRALRALDEVHPS